MSERSRRGASIALRILDWIAPPIVAGLVLALGAWLQAVKHDVYRDVFWEETSQIHYHGRFVQTIIVQNESPDKIAKIVVEFELDAPKGCERVDITDVEDWNDSLKPADVLVDADSIVTFSECEEAREFSREGAWRGTGGLGKRVFLLDYRTRDEGRRGKHPSRIHYR